MARKIMLVAATLILILSYIVFFLPVVDISARESGDFVLEGTMLKAYTGKDEVITIPGEVTEIGPEAFKNCTLTQVTIPSGVRKIGFQAFYGSKKLSRVVISEGVESVGISAFGDCPKLYMVSVPASVSEILDGAFCGCTSLSNLQLASENKNFFVNDGVLYNHDSTVLIQYLAGRRSTRFTIPFSVKKLSGYAFWGAKLLTDVRISNNVKEIPAHCFSNCIGLTYVYLPESIRRIGGYGFSDCKNLYYVAMESTRVSIAETAFDGCFESLKTERGVAESDANQKAKKSPKDGMRKVSDADGTSADKAEVSALNGIEVSGLNGMSAKGTAAKKSKPVTAFVPKTIKNDEINKSDKNLIGAARVSGGAAFIIPE